MTADQTMGETVFIYVTNPSREEAARIAKNLIDKKLIACANMFPIESIYRWEGKVVEEKEYALIAKTSHEKSKQVEDEVKKIHPYKIPCIITIPVSPNKEFKDWLGREIGP